MGRGIDADTGADGGHIHGEVSADDPGLAAGDIEAEWITADIERAAAYLRGRDAISRGQRLDIVPDQAGQDQPGRAPQHDHGDDDAAQDDDSLFHGGQSYLSRAAD